MYRKEEFYQLFRSAPLPFKIFSFSESGQPPETQTNSPLFYSHKMTTDITLKVFEECGFHQGTNAMICHILIGRSFTDPQLQTLNDFQKCCHFSSTYLMGTKSELHNRMKELSSRLGKQVPFYPRSYYPPDDYEELLEAWNARKYWIIKAPALSRAREIRVVSSDDEKPPMLPYVVEEYITPPYLITGRKFDIRLYALITSINPMTIYYHREGLGLFAVHEYRHSDDMNLSDLQMHLTNYEINRNSDGFIECDGTTEKIQNSKWSLPFLWKYFDEIGVDSKKLRQEIEDVSTSAIIACMCSIRNAQNKNIKHHRKSSFEFVGVDILLDENLKPYLLEINISPSMAGTSKLDEKIKLEVAHDLYNIVRILDVSSLHPKECMGYFAYEREYFLSKQKQILLKTQFVNNEESGGFLDGFFGLFSDNRSNSDFFNDKKVTREQAVIDGLIDPWDSPTFAEYTIVREFIEEQERSRGFHRAYPRRKNIRQFEKCFDFYNYEDIVLNKWISMDKRKRFEILIENFDMYYTALQKCCKIRDECDKPDIVFPMKSDNNNEKETDKNEKEIDKNEKEAGKNEKETGKNEKEADNDDHSYQDSQNSVINCSNEITNQQQSFQSQENEEQILDKKDINEEESLQSQSNKNLVNDNSNQKAQLQSSKKGGQEQNKGNSNESFDVPLLNEEGSKDNSTNASTAEAEKEEEQSGCLIQ